MRRLQAFVVFALLVPALAAAQGNGKLQIHYMDVGQGDGAVLISPQGEVVLFDDGVLNQCGKPIGYLQSLGVTKIDYHIASHYHADHIGCASQILSMFPLQKAAFDRGGGYNSNTFTSYVAAVGAKRATAVKGQTVTLDAGSPNPVTITFVALNGSGVPTTDENDLSLVSVVRFGRFDAEFGGDLSGGASGVVDGDPVDPSAPPPGPGPTPPSPTPPPAPPPGGDTCARPAGAPASATAVCNDGWFSSAQHRSGTCSGHGGVSCWICPGVLCSPGLVASGAGWASELSVTLASYADIESVVAPLVGQIEVYKVHHHGSRYSSNMAWLSTTTPKVGIVSVGSSNTYGHPTPEALNRLHSAGVKTYWTSAGNGAAPTPGVDVIAGNIEVLVGPGASSFEVIHGGVTDAYPVWSPPNPAPFGSFDTPAPGSVVAGEVGVTGWALDDSGIAGVDVYRSPVPGEPTQANGLVFIGTATLVAGARPDIAAAYPSYPGSQRAGWGYMLLSNMLPNQGNGTFTLSAFARAADGGVVVLGTKTLVLNNAAAAAPFGTVDTPGQGQTVSGVITSFGWALTPQPNLIPRDGSTINVYVDGVFLGHPTYDNYRADIATLFPGYANSGGAVGYFTLNTTALANGVHTIAWGVVDSAGHASGLGSRYFTVANAVSSGPMAASAMPAAGLGAAAAAPALAEAKAPPFGVLESPSAGAVVSGTIAVDGWALDLEDVPLTIELLVDGRVVSRAPSRGERAEVCSAYGFLAHCEHSRPGLTFEWDTTGEMPGTHAIAVRILDPAGQSAVVGERSITIRRSQSDR